MQQVRSVLQEVQSTTVTTQLNCGTGDLHHQPGTIFCNVDFFVIFFSSAKMCNSVQ